LSQEQLTKLYTNESFKDVEDYCISGGEPTCRPDLFSVTESALDNLNKVRLLFLTTNGTNPNKAEEFLKRFKKGLELCCVSISLDGDRETHKYLRGADIYDSALETAKACARLQDKNAEVTFSMTLSNDNWNLEQLSHVLSLSKELGVGFTFRPRLHNPYFGGHFNSQLDAIPKEKRIEVARFIRDYMGTSKFMKIEAEYLENGRIPIMGSRAEGIKCSAGLTSVFINSFGDIYPCMNSANKIGDYRQGITNKTPIVGETEPCPCCSECQVYPTMIFGGRK